MIIYRELASLVHDLGFSARTLYGVSNQIGRHYHRAEIAKPGGGTRVLHVPDALLKTIQRRINRVLLDGEPISPYATAYRPGGNSKLNAMPHVGAPLLLKLDILHFFDSIIYPLVKDKVFPAARFSESNRVLLTILCTHHDALPQGAPTSPAISNIIMRDFDQLIGEWCLSRGIVYSRYCDDMSFSGDFDPAPLIELVRRELGKMGFFLNAKKTALIRDGSRKTVTGLVVNERERVPAAYRRRLRQEIYYCRRFGIASHMEHEHIGGDIGAYIRSLLGRVNYVLFVSPDEADFADYRQWLLRQLKANEQAAQGE